MNIASLFFSHSQEKLLFTVDNGEIRDGRSPTELFRNIASIGKSLEGRLFPGDKVLILSGNQVETFEFTLAIFNAGAIAVPLNPVMQQDGLLDIVQRLTPAACLFSGTLHEDLVQALAPHCRLFITLTPGLAGNSLHCLDYQALLEGNHPLVFGAFRGDHPALIIHSSGSQGRPKVIIKSHENLLHYFLFHDLIHRQFSDGSGTGEPQKPLISVFHPNHLASYSLALQGLLMRRPTYLMPSFSPLAYLGMLSRGACRLALLVPSMYRALLKEEGALREYDFSALELCFSVGEPTPQALAGRIEETFGCRCVIAYGLTECLPGIGYTWDELKQGRIEPGSCGKLLFAEAILVDGKERNARQGELWLRNPTVHRCYEDDGLNEAKFTPDGWLRTGDLFRLDEEGFFFHQGRLDDMFIINGKNVYPAEVESTLLRHPDIESAVAAAVEGPRGETVMAVLLKTRAALPEADVINFYMRHGPRHAIPKHIEQSEQLPELGPGKLDRRSCRRLLQESVKRKSGSVV